MKTLRLELRRLVQDSYEPFILKSFLSDFRGSLVLGTELGLLVTDF